MNDESPSLLVRLLSIAFFSILTLAALAWFFISLVGLISQFHLRDPVIGFDKGSMYMFGIGLGLLLLTIGGVMQGMLGQELSQKKETLFKRGIVISLILMFSFPQLTNYLVDKYAYSHHYRICTDVTDRWLLYSKFYYTESKEACEKLVSEKEVTKISRGR